MKEKKSFGRKRWAIAEGYIPGWSHGPEPQFTSHETFCILNTGNEDAEVQVTVFFSDREPVGPYRVTVPARRTKHVRFNNLTDPEPAHPARFEAGRKCPDQHDCLLRIMGDGFTLNGIGCDFVEQATPPAKPGGKDEKTGSGCGDRGVSRRGPRSRH
jgi:hypothetical protein